jgi:hypothetical protein
MAFFGMTTQMAPSGAMTRCSSASRAAKPSSVRGQKKTRL